MKKRFLFIFSSLCLCIILTCSIPVSAAVFLSPFGDIVDDGGHLDWYADTNYYWEVRWAMNLWNAYRPGVIREDSFSTINDVSIFDINSSTAGYYGNTDKSTNTIYFNIYSMNKLNSYEKKSVAAHEFGHALGLGHNSLNANAVMTDIKEFPTVLDIDDKDSYDAAALLY